MPSLASFLTVALAASTATASALPRAAPFEAVKRQSSSSSSSSGNLTVDLGYEVYQGHLNETSGINQWNGIRFAAPPVGALRWQAPQPPVMNRSQVIDATNYGPMCVQNGDAPGPSPSSGQEDCLFLNVQAPANASNLPVFVWIHGGGYGLGNGRQDLAAIINENGNDFVGVSIQYRLGAFGFMSSDELFRRGVVNAGLLDQHFALQWVQSYIGMFGGNSSQVTISGESAGAGSVMLQGMAYGGTLGDSLFTNLHVASPYLPMQYGYKDWVPSQSYYAFADHAGCMDTNAYGGSSRTIFDCLQAQNTTTLMNASALVSESGTFGTWGFLPVTDGVFIQQTPSQQLLEKKVNGRNMLSGNNAEEGTLFTPQNITTEADLIAWLQLTFPLFSNDDISRILLFYPSSNASNSMPMDRFATNGMTGASALNESDTGAGQLERAENIYAETTFVCPSYWLAEAYTDNGRSSYKYQYSVVPATHGQDVSVYFGPHASYVGADISRAFMSILGNFATTENPSINNSIANGGNDSTTVNPASHWPAFSLAQPYMINLNQTGGHEVTVNGTTTLGIGNLGNITIYQGPGFKNDISLVNAWTWEQGRGVRCAFWRSVAAIVPDGLILGSIFLPSSASTSSALDRPVHLAATVLVAVACACIAFGRLLGRQSFSEIEQKYSAVPFEEGGGDKDYDDAYEPVSAHAVPQTIDFRRLRLVFVALIVAVLLRVEAFRRVVRTPQCKATSYDTALLFALAVLDYVFVRRHEKFRPDDENEQGSLYDVVVQYLSRAPWRFLVTTAVYSASAFVVSESSSPLKSTYICPSTLGLDRLIPVMQHFGTFLDFCIAVCVGSLVTTLHTPNGSKGLGKAFMTIGWAFAISAVIIWIEGAIWFITVPDDRIWLFTIPTHFLWSTIKFDFLACVFFLSFFASVHYIGVIASMLTASFTHITASAIGFVWANLHPFPPRADGQGFVHFGIMFVSVLAFFAFREAHKSTSNHGTRPVVSLGALLGVLVVLFILRSIAFVARTSSVSFHPIDLMIYDAQVSHEKYVQQATTSDNLDQAVSEYKRRYGRNPPPGFDKWYDFAVELNSTIIDDYDNIYNDLLPFWSLPPALIRHNLYELTSNPWNDVGGISVRDGKADISPNDMATHRWMLEGIVSMISQFEEWLPDMDLGFNMNDEPRVTVPYNSIQDMRRIGKGNHDHNPTARKDWSEDRASGWEMTSKEPLTYTPFTEKSFQRTFREWGNSACPPSSPAVTQNHWDVSTLCTTCTNAHSLGAFLANWTLSADICAQPDMSNLHGLYLSPAAFKASHDLLPIFSQSKAHGYNDILYPSAWNYMDKVAHAPTKEHPDKDYYSKSSTLFWRGATSEGVSPGTGTWTGMTRQRFLSVTNDNNLTAPVLLPYPFAPRGKMAYVSAPVSSLRASITTNVALVDTIARCGEPDCSAQAAQLGPLAKPVDFQSHWRHKYLLDLDGAGFSGRFLPFLQSGSLPFKAALFREWFDDRLAPWVHFVPLDARAHGLWATLMYFSGFEGWIKGKRVSVPAREKEGRQMALAGKEWANRVLRKEDMEVYMFRLLLEWGRVTDDRRDDLGFAGDGGGTGGGDEAWALQEDS